MCVGVEPLSWAPSPAFHVLLPLPPSSNPFLTHTPPFPCVSTTPGVGHVRAPHVGYAAAGLPGESRQPRPRARHPPHLAGRARDAPTRGRAPAYARDHVPGGEGEGCVWRACFLVGGGAGLSRCTVGRIARPYHQLFSCCRRRCRHHHHHHRVVCRARCSRGRCG
jgi:hypothetical protein